MKNKNIIFLVLAIITVGFLMLIGISISEGSIIGIILSILGTILIMGLGFTAKRNLREKGKIL